MAAKIVRAKALASGKGSVRRGAPIVKSMAAVRHTKISRLAEPVDTRSPVDRLASLVAVLAALCDRQIDELAALRAELVAMKGTK